MQSLKELIDKLPPELEKEVQDFIEFLIEKKKKKIRKKTEI
jgi:hypothetical protein